MLQLFLSAVQKGFGNKRKNAGGPFAAKKALAGLAFLAQHLTFPLEVFLLKIPPTLPEDSKATKTRNSPLYPRDLAVLRLWAHGETGDNAVVKHVAVLALLLVSGGVRFQHAQRSYLLRETEEGLVFHCKRGKNRKGGQPAPPFDWAVPHSLLLPKEVLDFFVHFTKVTLPEQGGFLVPALAPPLSALGAATGFAIRPSSDGAWRRVLRAAVSLQPERCTARDHPLPRGHALRGRPWRLPQRCYASA